MLYVEAEWPSKKYPNCRHTFGRIRQVARFKIWGSNYIVRGKNFCFCHIFNTNFSEHNCTDLLLYGGRIKADLDTVVILSGFASLLYHGHLSQKLVCLTDRLTSDTSL